MSLLSFCTPFPSKATTNKATPTKLPQQSYHNKKLSFEEIKIQKDKKTHK